MPRHANVQWNLPEADGTGHTWNSIHAALLMDIRDELQKLNRKLDGMPWWRITYAVSRIERNQRRPRITKRMAARVLARGKRRKKV